MSETPLRLSRLNDIGFLNLRGSVTDSAFKDAVRDAVGVDLPEVANTVKGEAIRVFWLGPDEWLLTATSAKADTCAVSLGDALCDQHAAINNMSGGLLTYRLSGSNARQLLAKGCSLDLHAERFGPDCCAQTGLAKATVLLSAPAREDGFEIVVRRSFADYLWQWLLRAGSNYGIEVA